MKGKMFKKVLLFASLFCLLFTMLAVSSSALTADDYPTIEDYRYLTSLIFSPIWVGDTDASLPQALLAQKLPVSAYRVEVGDDDFESLPIPALVTFETVNGSVIFDRAYMVTAVMENGCGWVVYNVTGFDSDGQPTYGNERLEVIYTDDGSSSLTYNLSATYYSNENLEESVLTEVDPIFIYTNEDYYSYLLPYEGVFYNSVIIDHVAPPVSETITNNWGDIFGWVVGALSSVQSVFYTNGSLTFLGILAVIGVAIAIAFLIIGVVQKFLSLRG